MVDSEYFIKECLWAHNELRRAHNVFPLVYDKTLGMEAEKYANILKEKKSFHRNKSEDRIDVGENVSVSSKDFINYIYSGLSATVTWYSEIKDYDFDKEVQNSKLNTDNFTQIVWKETERVGFGRVQNTKTKTWFIVARYYPTGNLKNKYKENVFPLINNLKWDKLSVVETCLEELKSWEYTNGRKHILDQYSFSITMAKDNKGFLVKENFKPAVGEVYHESQIFKVDVTKEPRPIFVNKLISNGMKKDFNYKPNSYSNNLLDGNSDYDEEIESFADCLVARHNLYRKNYGVEKLELDYNLSTFAQKWAETLASGHFMGFSNYQFKNSQIGENIALKSDELTYLSCKQLVDNWYNENKFYFYENEHGDIREFGHFTQIVWRNTKKIGIGISKSSSGLTFIVCFYHPPGNVKHEFCEMVPRLII